MTFRAEGAPSLSAPSFAVPINTAPLSDTMSSSSSSHSPSPSALHAMNALRTDEDDQFTALKWHTASLSALLAATDAIDLTCHAIVTCNHNFTDANDALSVEARRLALTVAVFERSLYAYAIRISTEKTHSQQSTPQTAKLTLARTEPQNALTSQTPRDITVGDPTLNALHSRLTQANHNTNVSSPPPSLSPSPMYHAAMRPLISSSNLSAASGSPYRTANTEQNDMHKRSMSSFYQPGMPLVSSPHLDPAMLPTQSATPHLSFGHSFSGRSPSVHPITAGYGSPMLMPTVAGPTSVSPPIPPTTAPTPLDPTHLSSASPHPPLYQQPLQSYSSVSTPTSHPTSRPSWHQPAGMTCLLKILTHQLMETRTVLLAINKECSSFYNFMKTSLKRFIRFPSKLRKFVKSQRILTGSLVLVLAAIAYRFRLSYLLSASSTTHNTAHLKAANIPSTQAYLHRSLTNAFGSNISSLILSLIPPPLIAALPYAQHIASPFVLYSYIITMLTTRSSLTLIPVVFYILYRYALYAKLKRLRLLHSRLGLLLRLWHICSSLLDMPQGRGETDSDGDLIIEDRVPISRWMLELVPPELDASFWYQSSTSLATVKHGLDVLYCSVNSWYTVSGSRPIGIPVLILSALYYAVQPTVASRTASRLMGSPDIRVVRQAWELLDLSIARRLIVEWLPKLTPSFPPFAIYRQIELSEMDDERSREFPSIRLRSVSASEANASYDTALKVLLLSAKPMTLSINVHFRRVASHSSIRSIPSSSSPVIIYCHGGGWMADFQASHLVFLSKWANTTDALILYVQYSLSPDNAYPQALNEIYELYKWVCDGRLGLTASSIVLCGDSTGGNLAAACTMRAIQEKVRVPDGLVLAYPILNLRLTPTPSRALHMIDAVLPMNLLLQCRSLYLPSHCDADTDPCLSPVVASDELLEAFPPTDIMVGQFDPFIDDAIDFAHRLDENNVSVRLKVYDQLPHSFLDFSPILSQSTEAIALAGEWLKSHFKSEAKPLTSFNSTKLNATIALNSLVTIDDFDE